MKACRIIAYVIFLSTAGFVFLQGTSTPSYSQYDYSDEERIRALNANLVLLLHMDEGPGATTFIDSSYTGGNATCTNCPDMGQTGKYLSAGLFNGTNDELSVADDNDLDFGTGDFSLTLWMYPTVLGARDGIFDKADGTNGYRLFIDDDDAQRLEFVRGYNFETGVSMNADGLTANQWHHVAAVNSSSSGTIYVNGTGYGSAALEDNANTAENLAIANKTYAPSSVQFFPGMIDEVAFYDVALTRGEIQALYRRGKWRHRYDRTFCNGIDCDYRIAFPLSYHQFEEKLFLDPRDLASSARRFIIEDPSE